MIAEEPTTRPTLRDVARRAYLERLAEFEQSERDRLALLAQRRDSEARALLYRVQRSLGLDWLDCEDVSQCSRDDLDLPIVNIDGCLFRLRGSSLQLGLARDDWRTVSDAADVYRLIGGAL